jgi:hypothetical protein
MVVPVSIDLLLVPVEGQVQTVERGLVQNLLLLVMVVMEV